MGSGSCACVCLRVGARECARASELAQVGGIHVTHSQD